VSSRTVLVLGGVRAGKSAFAVARARAIGGRVVFVATAEAGDPEMVARILRHQAERPPAWRTIEVPVELPSALTALVGTADTVIVDCLNLWVANLLQKRPELSDSDVLAEAAALEAVVAHAPFSLILVSNEVGWGVHPETALGRRFRDALGFVNQAAARAANEVVLMVAGCPITVKPS
jgi:adenosylcobinamide kinase/adenosylcobinamide-phosphate guanylyltransferase